MDLALDYKQSRAFMCPSCDSGMQRLRNCGGLQESSRAPMKVNGRIYRVCPRSLTFNKDSENFLVGLYFDCKENKTWPFQGSILNQTAYCKEAFDLLDGIAADYREREQKRLDNEMKKNAPK